MSIFEYLKKIWELFLKNMYTYYKEPNLNQVTNNKFDIYLIVAVLLIKYYKNKTNIIL